MAHDALLRGCFALEDRNFAGHANAEARALQWLILLRERGTTWPQARAQIQEFLNEIMSDQKHIAKQMARARERLKPWLADWTRPRSKKAERCTASRFGVAGPEMQARSRERRG